MTICRLGSPDTLLMRAVPASSAIQDETTQSVSQVAQVMIEALHREEEIEFHPAGPNPALFLARKVMNEKMKFIAKMVERGGNPCVAKVFKAVDISAGLFIKTYTKHAKGMDPLEAFLRASAETGFEAALCTIPYVKLALLGSDLGLITEDWLLERDLTYRHFKRTGHLPDTEETRKLKDWEKALIEMNLQQLSLTFQAIQLPRRAFNLTMKTAERAYQSEGFQNLAFNPLGAALVRRDAAREKAPVQPPSAAWEQIAASPHFSPWQTVLPDGTRLPGPPSGIPSFPIPRLKEEGVKLDRAPARTFTPGIQNVWPNPNRPHFLYKCVRGSDIDPNVIIKVEFNVPLPYFLPSPTPIGVVVNVVSAIYFVCKLWHENKKQEQTKEVQKHIRKLTDKLNTALAANDKEMKALEALSETKPNGFHVEDSIQWLKSVLAQGRKTLQTAGEANTRAAKLVKHTDRPARHELRKAGLVEEAGKQALKETCAPAQATHESIENELIPALSTHIIAAETELQRLERLPAAERASLDIEADYQIFNASTSGLLQDMAQGPLSPAEQDRLAVQASQCVSLAEAIYERERLLGARDLGDTPPQMDGEMSEYLGARLRLAASEKSTQDPITRAHAMVDDVRIRVADCLFLASSPDENRTELSRWEELARSPNAQKVVQDVYHDRALQTAQNYAKSGDPAGCAKHIEAWISTAENLGFADVDLVERMAGLYSIVVSDEQVATPLLGERNLRRLMAPLPPEARERIQPFLDAIDPAASQKIFAIVSGLAEIPLEEHRKRLDTMRQTIANPSEAHPSEVGETAQRTYNLSSYLYALKQAEGGDFAASGATIKEWLGSLNRHQTIDPQTIINAVNLYFHCLKNGQFENPKAFMQIVQEIQSTLPPTEALALKEGSDRISAYVQGAVTDAHDTYREMNLVAELVELATSRSQHIASKCINVLTNVLLHPQIFQKFALPRITTYFKEELLQKIGDVGGWTSHLSLAMKVLPTMAHAMRAAHPSAIRHPWIRSIYQPAQRTMEALSLVQKAVIVNNSINQAMDSRRQFAEGDYLGGAAQSTMAAVSLFSTVSAPLGDLLEKRISRTTQAVFRALSSPRFSLTLTGASIVHRYGDLGFKWMKTDPTNQSWIRKTTAAAMAVLLGYHAWMAFNESRQELALDELQKQIEDKKFQQARVALKQAVAAGFTSDALFEEYISSVERLLSPPLPAPSTPIRPPAKVLADLDKAQIQVPAAHLRLEWVKILISQEKFAEAEVQMKKMQHPVVHLLRAEIAKKQVNPGAVLGHLKAAHKGYDELLELLYVQCAPQKKLDEVLATIHEIEGAIF